MSSAGSTSTNVVTFLANARLAPTKFPQRILASHHRAYASLIRKAKKSESAENSNPTVANCTFSENRGSFIGGGMYNREYSNPTITNCTFGGDDLRTLYVACGTLLLRIRTKIPGKPSYRPRA